MRYLKLFPFLVVSSFGDGYMINVRCNSNSEDRVLLEIEGTMPEARLREKRNCQIVWHVEPNVLSISTMFLRMEEVSRRNPDITDYSISQTSLDDVFIRFAAHQYDADDCQDDQGRHLTGSLAMVFSTLFMVFSFLQESIEVVGGNLVEVRRRETRLTYEIPILKFNTFADNIGSHSNNNPSHFNQRTFSYFNFTFSK